MGKKTLADMSQDLIWACVKNNSAFLVQQCKNNGKVTFTTEPNNLTGKNTFKFSGLANKKAVGVSANADGGCVLSVKAKKGSATRKPVKMFSKFTLTKDFRRVAKTIVNETSGNHYRADLKDAALARWSAIHKSQKAAGAGVTKKARGRKSRK